MFVPDEQIPATPEQIKAFLNLAIPIAEEQNRQTLDNIDAAVHAHLSMLEQQTRAEHEAYEQTRFFEQIQILTYHGDEWVRQLGRWFTYVLRSFATQPIEQRRAGFWYTLPKGLQEQFAALTPEQEERILAALSHPVLQVIHPDDQAYVIALRQLDA
jgi:hypothetical protein